MVEDSNLAVHLAHFGINMSKMKKSDKTMAELEIDINQKLGEWDRIQESGSKLVPLFGPGYTGMRNLGNSCYMNSVMQVIFTLPDFLRKYLNNRDAYLRNSANDASNDFNYQMSKLAYGLLSGEYSKQEQIEQNISERLLRPPKGIKPITFKSLIGKGHAEFSTKRQQDAHEFFMHLISFIERNLRNDSANNYENPTDCLKFKIEERTECAQSNKVKYTYRDEYCLPVPISKDLALNKDKLKEFEQKKADLESQGKKLEPGELVRPEISLLDCLNLITKNEHVTDFYSSATKTKGIALKSTRFATFPDFLLLQAKKFDFAADWSPIKLDVSLQVPDMLDLTLLKGNGKQPNEQELPQDDAQQQPQQQTIVLNESIVSQLTDMGFSVEGSKRAAYNTRDLNDAEAAVNWAVSHMEDSDFNLPFQLPSTANNKSGNKTKQEYPDDSIASITSLGFNRQQAIKALDSTNGDVMRAADWIFSHMDELMDTGDSDTASAGQPQQQQLNQTTYRDGSGKYKLVAFISHMGTNANVGHYVAHILKDEKWCLFNDENVFQSENPPKDLAYLYLFKRV
jgi:ubiquitin carboxyl-terminal hydrolase 5/13